MLEPSLTFHGFRYAEGTGVPDLAAEDVHDMVVGNDLRRTGWFSCSDPDLEQFHENVVRSTRGNFLDVPTDCPQRDERLGWTGGIQVFSPTVSFPDGAVPWVVPDVLDTEHPTAAAWGDAGGALGAVRAPRRPRHPRAPVPQRPRLGRQDRLAHHLRRVGEDCGAGAAADLDTLLTGTAG